MDMEITLYCLNAFFLSLFNKVPIREEVPYCYLGYWLEQNRAGVWIRHQPVSPGCMCGSGFMCLRLRGCDCVSRVPGAPCLPELTALFLHVNPAGNVSGAAHLQNLSH